LNDNEIKEYLLKIQAAFDRKDLSAVLSYYHPEISYIGPAFPKPIEGIERLKAAFERHFQAPQRTNVSYEGIKIYRLSSNGLIIHCLVEGSQSIYLSQQRFRGWLTRILIGDERKPVIIHEHFSLIEEIF
jgi:hypothetical protein